MALVAARQTFRSGEMTEHRGAGVAPAALGRVFDLYVRLDLRRPGLGLGLATVKRLVEAHRGKVGVEPRPGGGCRFWLTLPRAPGPAKAEQLTA